MSFSSIDKKQDTILKLRLVGVEGPAQIRRVKLNRLHIDGNLSYDALVDVAIMYTFPNAPLIRDDYDVTLTYYDVDNDCVTIASTEELADAIEQFESLQNPVLRVTTDVKKKLENPSNPTQNPSRATKGTDTAYLGENKNQPAEKPAQLPPIVDAIVSVLSTAVDALQKQVVEMNQPAANKKLANNRAHAGTGEKQRPIANNDDTADAERLVKEIIGNFEMNVSHEAQLKPQKREFIHGRHTCDACLCTPIVGTRYHATNMPDYDVCSKCRDNYKGNEIQFEAVELDRDRPFQDRWHEKRARLANRACRPQGRGPGFRGGNRRGSFRGPHFRGQCGRGRPSFDWRHNELDGALKEAIRRSLQDVQDTAADKPEPTAPVEEDNVTVTSNSSKTTEDEDIAEEELVKEAVLTAEVVLTADVEVVVEADDTKEDSTIVMLEQNQKSCSSNTSEDSTVTDASKEAASVKADQNEDSFSSDALGNGEAAERLGQTLDECAHAINAMVLELDRACNDTASIDDDKSVDEEVTIPAPMLVETVSDEEASVGEKIVDGEEPFEEDHKSEGSEDEWDFVADNEEEQIANDEMIARAAQLIGSSLFQSDMRNSEVAVTTASTLTNSGNFIGDDFSIPSSVPSVSSISTAVLNRWSMQLSKLHELGFHDEKKSVEILERISAARIGVEDDEEVSVTDVVNDLLKR